MATRSEKTPKKNESTSQPGFYSRVMDEAEKLDFELAANVNGIDDEIALLRVKIKELVNKDPENLELIMKATNLLAKLVKTRYSMSKGQNKGLAEAIKNVIKDIGVPLGVALITKKLK